MLLLLPAGTLPAAAQGPAWTVYMPYVPREGAPCVDPYEPNDDRRVNPTGPLAAGVPVRAFLCRGDEEDNYYLQMGRAGRLDVNLELPASMVNHTAFWVYAASNMDAPLPACSRGIVDRTQTALSCDLGAGRYILRIYSHDPAVYYDHRAPYTIRPAFPPPAPTSTPTRRPTLTATPTRPATPTPTSTATPGVPTGWMVVREAEAGEVSRPMAAARDVDASACEYVRSPAVNNGAVTLAFDVPADGYYAIWGRMQGEGWGGNSFFVSVDGRPADVEEVGTVDGEWVWHWERAGSAVVGLSAGRHTVTFAGREPRARLDAVALTGAFAPAPAYVAPCEGQ